MADRGPPAAAGWYPDPDGDGHRWWNGERWTDAVAPDTEPEDFDAEPDGLDARPSVVGIVAFTAGAGALVAAFVMNAGSFALFFVGGAMAIALAIGARVQGDRSRLAVLGAVLGVAAFGVGIWGYQETQRLDEETRRRARCAVQYADMLAGGSNLLQEFDSYVQDCGGLHGDD